MRLVHLAQPVELNDGEILLIMSGLDLVVLTQCLVEVCFGIPLRDFEDTIGVNVQQAEELLRAAKRSAQHISLPHVPDWGRCNPSLRLCPLPEKGLASRDEVIIALAPGEVRVIRNALQATLDELGNDEFSTRVLNVSFDYGVCLLEQLGRVM